MVCPSCGQANRESANYCRFCGAHFAIACPRCRATLLPDSAFCDICGFQLGAAPATQPAPAIAQPTPTPAARPAALPSTLHQYIPAELMKKLEAARATGEMVGERRIVTMLFCDVKGSTAAAEQLDPEDYSEIMNGAFTHMIRPVYRYEGTLARLMGDALLAFFGAPIAHEDDPQRAVLAGLDILAAMREYREQIRATWGLEFDVRVGINTGLVVVGAVGSDLRMEYSALGDAINLAARMEQTAAPGSVQIAHETYKAVRHLFEVENLGGIAVKGKAEPVQAYRVLSHKAAGGQARGIEGLRAAMVGREAEMTALREVINGVRDCYACADPKYRINIRVINENPWSNLFAYNMFLRPNEQELDNFKADWYLIQAPGFKADPALDGTRQQNFAIINFTRKTILIGGTGYTGEIKKAIFSVLNFILPHQKNVLSMHCSANIGKDGDTAIFFGLSGTGKTTLSADPKRKLIGDDEHGWTGNSVFNFEGGCYAKTIDLNESREPEIFRAIRPGALVENVTFVQGSSKIDFASKKITENTRVSYPLSFISNAIEPSIGNKPTNIFFLTCDAYGILPPISKLSAGQAMYQFISGYTAKVAGTEAGITEPKATFSACFGAPFMPLHPGVYADMLGKKMKAGNVNVWMINTGWSGGPHGIGKRMQLDHTRAMITAALDAKLNNAEFKKHSIFGVLMPTSCPGVPTEILDPKNTWQDKTLYDVKAKELAKLFITNFEKYSAGVTEEILASAPQL